MPKSVTYLNWIPIFKWYEVMCGFKNGYQKDLFKRDWTTCLEHDNHSRLSSQHNWGTYMTLNEPKNFQFDNKSDVHLNSGDYGESGYGLN